MKNIRLAKIIVISITTLLLISCGSIKKIIPFAELKPKDLEPRVSFVDTKDIEVKPTTIKAIDPAVVIRSYERLLTRENPAIRQEALHRLADLTMRLAETKIDATPEQQAQQSSSVKNSSFTKAIALYQTLLNEFPNYPSIDEVKYQLARAYSMNSDPSSSLAILDQIAVKHTESLSFLESQFRRGEAYFVRKKYRTAEDAYTEVILKGENTEYYDKALYKRGWSLFKQNLFPEAQNDFFKLYERLVYQRKNAAVESRLLNDLITDTRRVISLSFYNQDGAESVREYFEKNGKRDFESEIYLALAELYIEQERFQDAADTFKGFIDRNPVDLAAPDFHTRMIGVYKKGGFPSLILPAKESFVVNYGRKSAFWQKYSGKVLDDLKPLLRLHLDDISKFYHAKAQQSKKPEDYLVAAKWYREILASFGEPAIDSQYRYALAEALFDGGQLGEAAKEFETVAYKNPQSKFSRDAGYKALVAYQNLKQPKNATQLEKLLPSIQSGLKFSQAFPSDKKAPEILSRVAEQQLMIENVQGAIDASNQLLLLPSKPTKKQTDRARIIIANGLFDLKQYAKAEEAITDLLKTAKLSKKQRNNFIQRRAESVYQLADAAKADNKVAEATALFMKVRTLAPNSSVAVNAHYDAATLFLQSENWSQAAKLFEQFRKQNPKHQLTKSIPEKLAFIYEKQENWNKAAGEYQSLSAGQNDPELAREGMWRVAELYLKANNNKRAIDAFKNYVWKYPEPYLLAQEGRNHLVQLYTKIKDPAKALFWRQKIVDFYPKGKNNTRTSFLAAESKYILSENLFNEFKRIKLKLPLAKTLKKKRSVMKKALAAYNDIAKYGVAKYTTASTHKVALIYQTLSDDLMSSQRPKGLNEDELEEYGFLLEDQALPFEDKAINFFEINAQRTANDVYDESVRASMDALKKLKPAQYDKVERLEVLNDIAF